MESVGVDIFKKCCLTFWHAPADAFSRAIEAIVWQRQEVKSPVLDIGCGDGGVSKFLFKGKKKIDVGLDINKESVRLAKESGFYKQVRLGDATRMPFKSSRFKTVISNSTFEHIENDRLAVKEVARVLKKGGSLMLTVPTKRLKKQLVKYLKKDKLIKAFDKRLEHWHYRSLAEWRQIMKKNGLEIIKHEYYFPDRAVRVWLKLFRLMTFKPYKRELWSYLKDPRFEKLLPKRLIAYGFYYYLRGYFRGMFDADGNLLFIKARKLKSKR